MTGADPADKSAAGPGAASPGAAGRAVPRHSNLTLRIVSSLVLVPLALAAAYAGGPVFLAFWTVAAVGVLWEWDTLVCTGDRNPVLAAGLAALVAAAAMLAIGWTGAALALVALGLFGVATLAASVHRSWCAAGLLYAAALLIATVLLRADATWGLAAIVFLFVIVWLTDIAAYFTGRALGGPKLMPSVSPNKTWSGAVGGTLAGTIGGVLTARAFGAGNLAAVGAVALTLSVVSQAGDLLESAVKRRFDAKDAGSLIPGHGGLMDRLDGFLVAVAAAALIGLAHGGAGAPARGLMVW
ncbi:MAG: phosphatidate cytidylyltransferase [Alphaproteobacteria bacterium]|nr:phosphatidate cytidylyltransferase [Alphaproteobacteria bacterium]